MNRHESRPPRLRSLLLGAALCLGAAAPAVHAGGAPDRRRRLRRSARDPRARRARGHQQRHRRDRDRPGVPEHRGPHRRGALHLPGAQGRQRLGLQHVDQRHGDGGRGARAGTRAGDLRELQAHAGRPRAAGAGRLQQVRDAHLPDRRRRRAARARELLPGARRRRRLGHLRLSARHLDAALGGHQGARPLLALGRGQERGAHRRHGEPVPRRPTSCSSSTRPATTRPASSAPAATWPGTWCWPTAWSGPGPASTW